MFSFALLSFSSFINATTGIFAHVRRCALSTINLVLSLARKADRQGPMRPFRHQLAPLVWQIIKKGKGYIKKGFWSLTDWPSAFPLFLFFGSFINPNWFLFFCLFASYSELASGLFIWFWKEKAKGGNSVWLLLAADRSLFFVYGLKRAKYGIGTRPDTFFCVFV